MRTTNIGYTDMYLGISTEARETKTDYATSGCIFIWFDAQSPDSRRELRRGAITRFLLCNSFVGVFSSPFQKINKNAQKLYGVMSI